ncbi:hypothetical protein JCM10213_005833 [Rhodosporidiobolus nylandii]
MSTPPLDTDAPLRAYLRPLASSLVPPSSPVIRSFLSTATASLDLTPLETGHAERNIDFWDARALPQGPMNDPRRAEGERWEMSEGQVGEAKAARRRWVEQKRAADEDARVELAPWPASYKLSDDIILSRHAQLASRAAPAPAAGDAKQQLAALAGPPPDELMPEPDEALLKMDAMPDVEEGLDLKLQGSLADFAYLRSARAQHKDRVKAATEPLFKDEERLPLAAFPRSPSPRLGSPPLFARRAAHALPSVDEDKTRSQLVLTSDISDLPSSPRGRGVSMEEWNREEGIPPVPLSPSEVHAAAAARELTLWSSDPPAPRLGGDGVEEDYVLEKPLFPRPRQRWGGEFDLAALIKPPEADDDEVDELDSDGEDDLARLAGSAAGKSVRELLASDDTVGEGLREEAGDVAQLRLKVPSLDNPLSTLPSPPTIPSLPDFATSSPSPFALAPLPGLRSLSIALPWDFLPASSSAVQGSLKELVDEPEGKEEERLRRKARGWRKGLLEGMEGGEEGLVGGWPGREEEEEEEERSARNPHAGQAQAEEPAKEGDKASTAGDVEQDEDSEMQVCTVDQGGGTVLGERDLQGGSRAGPVLAAHEPTAALAASPQREHGTVCALPAAQRSTAAVTPVVACSRPPAPTTTAVAPPPPPALFTSSSPGGFVFLPSSPSPVRQEPVEAVEAVEETAEVHEETASRAATRTASPPETGEQQPWSGTQQAPPSSALDSLVAARLSRQVEKAKPSASRSSTSAALDRFLLARGKAVAPSPSSSPRVPAAAPSTSERPPSPHSSPPPGSIPFTIPPFLASPSSIAVPRTASLRVVAFDALFQQREHLRALRDEGILPVHRPSRFPSAAGVSTEPHLILDARTAVLIVPLPSLIGNARRPAEEAPSAATPAPGCAREAVITTLLRLLRRFDQILLVLEERQTRVGTAKTYSWTPPVLNALQVLADGLADLEGGEGGVQVALSKGERDTAGIVRRFAEWLEREQEDEGARPPVDVWGEREWLTEDPSQDETALLLHLPDLNELSTQLVLATSSVNEFAGMSAEDRLALYGSLLGEARVNRISAILASLSHPAPSSAYGSSHPSCGDLPANLSFAALPPSSDFSKEF